MSHDRITNARELLERFPGNDLARYNLAQALYDTGDYAGSADHLRQLCAKKSEWMVVHILLGKCLLHTGQSDEAKNLLKHALQLAISQHHDGPREELEELLKTL